MRKLEFELVPQSMWYCNLRKMLPEVQWTRIKNAVRTRSGYHCEICGRIMEPRQLDTHETWVYDDKYMTQSLGTIRCLCKDCHTSIHIGNARMRGVYKQGIEWYCKVNEISLEEGLEDEKKAFQVWHERSMHEYNLIIDKGIIKDLIGEEPKLRSVSRDGRN